MSQSAPPSFCSPFQGVVETLSGGLGTVAALSSDDLYLWRAAQQADLGQGRCSPNPPVGALVVRDDEVVGQGFHARAGGVHGEVAALDQAGSQARGATLYVTLEPCNHHGRTGPCTERIIREGVGRVVVGVRDPNPRVVGNGIARLQEAGIEVSIASGAVAARCQALIAPFAKSSIQQSPWVIAKVAVSDDGCVGKAGVPRYPITGPEAQRWVHTLRDRVDAILIGAGTAMTDDPSLTVRHEHPSRSDGKNPLRIVIDGALRTSPNQQVYQRQARDVGAGASACVVHRPGVNESKMADFDSAGIRRIEVDAENGRISLSALWEQLARLDIVSVLVEPGPGLYRALVGQNAIHELWWLQAPIQLGETGLRLMDAPRDSLPAMPNFHAGIQRHPVGADWLHIGTIQG